VKGGVIPTVFIPAVEKGVRQALDHGVICGLSGRGPARDRLRRQEPRRGLEGDRVRDRGRKAVIDAILKASPIMLEPIVNIEITAPDRFVGDLTSDLSASAGR
jgi:elongation factor G